MHHRPPCARVWLGQYYYYYGARPPEGLLTAAAGLFVGKGRFWALLPAAGLDIEGQVRMCANVHKCASDKCALAQQESTRQRRDRGSVLAFLVTARPMPWVRHTLYGLQRELHGSTPDSY